MSQGVESEAGEPGGEREYRDQTAASTPGHPNSSETASSKRGSLETSRTDGHH